MPVFAAGGWLPLRRGRIAHAAAATPLERAIADIESGRRTTPLVAGSPEGGDPTVTFLAKGSGGEALLIPGRRLQPADIEALAAVHRAPPLRLAILAAKYDRANIETARLIRQAFVRSGHSVRFTEVPEGHNQTTWRSHLGTVLGDIVGTGAR